MKQNNPRAPGQVWEPKAWPGRLFCLLYRDEDMSDDEAEVWAVLDLETAELRDLSFNMKIPTHNKRVA